MEILSKKVSFYLAHPTLSRHVIREWELKVEKDLGIILNNPFYDGVEREEVNKIDTGKLVPFSRTFDPSKIVLGDFDLIDESDAVLSIIDENLAIGTSMGTSMEMMYSKENYIPVLTICFDRSLRTHPWLRYCAEKVFSNFRSFEKYWRVVQKFNESFNFIGLVGRKQSGKDVVGNYLIEKYGFQRFAFADEIKVIAKRLYNFTRAQIQDKPPKVRKTLQQIGTEGIRGIYPDTWVNLVLTRLERYIKVLPIKYKQVVVTDVRFQNEAEILRKHGFKLVRINRDNMGTIDTHTSEIELDNIEVDFEIDNNKSFHYLFKQVEKLV